MSPSITAAKMMMPSTAMKSPMAPSLRRGGVNVT
jgi:hypothetical protein